MLFKRLGALLVPSRRTPEEINPTLLSRRMLDDLGIDPVDLKPNRF